MLEKNDHSVFDCFQCDPVIQNLGATNAYDRLTAGETLAIVEANCLSQIGAV